MTAATARKKPGRPATTMTPAICKRVAEYVAQGLRHDRAAVAAGVDPAIARRHKSRNKAYDQQLARAEAECESSLLGIIRSASKKQWTAAAWMLERRWPDQWAKPEIQLRQTNVSMSAEDVVKGINAFLVEAEKRHSPDTPDVDADEPSEAAA